MPDNQLVLRRLLQTPPPGGVLAAQIGDIGETRALVLMRELAEEEP